MAESIKLVFAGAVGSGKSTAIKAMSAIDVVSTDVRPISEANFAKATTTVAMDYGELSLSDGTIAKLYGVPGQKRFDYMWNIVAHGAVGLAFMVNDLDANSCELLTEYFDAFAEHRQNCAVVVGVTHLERATGKPLAKYHDLLQRLQLNYPVFPIDARQRDDVLLLIEALAAQVEN